MLIRAGYRGINYHEPVPPGKTTADMQVFEPTKQPNSFSVATRVVILQPRGSDLVVGEEFGIVNKTQPPVAYYRDDGTFLFSVPKGAQLRDVSAASSSGMFVVQSPMDKGNNVSGIAFAFRPGESSVRITYNLPYAGDQATIHLTSSYSADRVVILAPPSVRVAADGFAPAGSDQGFSVYMHEAIAAGKVTTISASGAAPMSASNGTSDSGGDGSQNPSVNSRLDDSGAEAPTATATTLPARLDGLKWILVAGFALLFFLGFIFLWRRPEAAGAAASDVSQPVATHATAQSPRVSATSASASVSEVDSAVEGSLSLLKEGLFRLEMRRQAGTIAEEDYARERQRIEKLLGDLVRV